MAWPATKTPDPSGLSAMAWALDPKTGGGLAGPGDRAAQRLAPGAAGWGAGGGAGWGPPGWLGGKPGPRRVLAVPPAYTVDPSGLTATAVAAAMRPGRVL